MNCIISMFIFKEDAKSKTAGNRWAERQENRWTGREATDRQVTNRQTLTQAIDHGSVDRRATDGQTGKQTDNRSWTDRQDRWTDWHSGNRWTVNGRTDRKAMERQTTDEQTGNR